MNDSITIPTPYTSAQLALIAQTMKNRARHAGIGAEQLECLVIAKIAERALAGSCKGHLGQYNGKSQAK